MVWERELDIYGSLRKGDNEFVPFLYQGQYVDGETGLAYNRFRYYDPDIGSFISQDPIGLNGGLTNLYGYVRDSNTWVDIFGLECSKGFTMRSKKKTNKTEGLRRESTLKRILEDIHGEDKVLSKRILLDANGNKVVDPSGKGRRIDFIVLDNNGNAIKSYEVTSKTARKTAQIAKENFIRNNGGTFIRDANGNLVDISNVPTQIRIK